MTERVLLGTKHARKSLLNVLAALCRSGLSMNMGWWSLRQSSTNGIEEPSGLEQRVLEQESELGLLRVQLERMQTELQNLQLPSQAATLLPRKPLTAVEALIDERIRTLSLVVCAMAVVYFAMWTLSEVLILFFLAVALKYLLTPLIDLLSCRHPRSESYRQRCAVRLTRKWAVLFTLIIAFFTLIAGGFIVANSLATFASRTGECPSSYTRVHPNPTLLENRRDARG